MTTRHRRRNMSPELQKRIEEKAASGYSATDIYRELVESGPENLPKLRTVQNVVKAKELPDESGPWSVANKDKYGAFLDTPEDARIILDVLADVIIQSGRKRAFTMNEAKWVLRIRKLAPDISCGSVWDLARSYMVAENKEDPTEATDAYLAFKPWMSKNRLEHYEYALKVGYIKEDPDRPWELARMKRDMESHQALPTSALDGDPSVLHPEIWWLEHEGPGALDEMTKIDRIGKQNPELGKRIKKVWDDAHQQYVDLTKKRGEKAKFRGDLRVSWIKYKALLNSFETEAS